MEAAAAAWDLTGEGVQAREVADAVEAMEVPSEAAVEMPLEAAVEMGVVIVVVVVVVVVVVIAMEEAETTADTAARGLQSQCVVNTAMYHPCSAAYRR